MRATFAIAALAGSALAAPYDRPQKQVKSVHWVVHTVVHTVYMTEGAAAKPTSTPAKPVYEAPAVTTVVYKEPATSAPVYEAPATSTYVAPAPQPTSEAPVPQPTSETPAPAPAPTSSGYMGVVDTWRGKMGLKLLIHDAKLEANALDCVTASNGQMVHKLNPGSFGQVLAPGNENDFEHVFVGGWLCEIPTLAGLDGVCQSQSQGWSYQGQTGHAKILTDPSYSKIGCALFNGIWGCDVA